MKIFGLELAPLKIPLERRLQTAAVCFFVFTFLQCISLIGIFLFVYLLFTRFYWLSLLYALWYYLDHQRCHEG